MNCWMRRCPFRRGLSGTRNPLARTGEATLCSHAGVETQHGDGRSSSRLAEHPGLAHSQPRPAEGCRPLARGTSSALEQAGFELSRQRGSHAFMCRPRSSPVVVRRTRGTFRAVRCSASSAARESAARSLSICSAADPHASRPRGIPFALVPLAAWVDSCSHFRSPKRARKEKQE